MTTNNLVKDILNGIIQAQYESYQHSKRLGEQDFKLLPIPYAEIAEITLDLKYAYEGIPDEEESYEELDLIGAFNELEPFFRETLAKVLSQLVELTDDKTADTNEEWKQIRDNLLGGKLNDHILTDFKSRFINDLGRKVKKNSLGDYYKVAESLLGDLLIQALHLRLIRHDDFTEHVARLNERLVNEIFQDVHVEFEKNRLNIQAAFNASIIQKSREARIIVDSEKLAKMPADSIQEIKLCLHVKNMIRETSNSQ